MAATRPPGRRRRDRRGRGLRGELLAAGTGSPALDQRFGVPAPLPDALTRSDRFEEIVSIALDELEQRWARELSRVDFSVEDVPPVAILPSQAELAGFDPADDPVPLSYSTRPVLTGGEPQPASVVLYRRPMEARSHGRVDLAELVFDVLVHELAGLLGRTPEEIDPEGHGGAE